MGGLKKYDAEAADRIRRRDLAIREMTHALRTICGAPAFFGETQALQRVARLGLEAAGSLVALPVTS